MTKHEVVFKAIRIVGFEATELPTITDTEKPCREHETVTIAVDAVVYSVDDAIVVVVDDNNGNYIAVTVGEVIVDANTVVATVVKNVTVNVIIFVYVSTTVATDDANRMDNFVAENRFTAMVVVYCGDHGYETVVFWDVVFVTNFANDAIFVVVVTDAVRLDHYFFSNRDSGFGRNSIYVVLGSFQDVFTVRYFPQTAGNILTSIH